MYIVRRNSAASWVGSSIPQSCKRTKNATASPVGLDTVYPIEDYVARADRGGFKRTSRYRTT
jgi:hypothetical protein